MILEHLPLLAQRKIVLASASPRRSELLRLVGLHFQVVVSQFEENLPKNRYSPAQYAVETATRKAQDVATLRSNEKDIADLIIAADTVVEVDGDVLEKPADGAEAYAMLSRLSGREHKVHTGVVLALPKVNSGGADAPSRPPLIRSFSETTSVVFAELMPEEIQEYIASGEPFGKAGAYGIQGKASLFVSSLQGCYFNVMGFPLHAFARELSAVIREGALAAP